ncbi:hypothetical protein T484DRAFT_1884547 [Baffinella frigidus]|nr:hypothetical protein T484DRAFT_1884547 [Cryptophyta sp. CCMP2293]
MPRIARPLQVLLVGLLAVGLRAEVMLNLKENIKLPSSYANNMFSTNVTDHGYEWLTGTAEKSDFMDNFVVVVGETKFVQVLNMAKYKTMQSNITDAKYIDAPGTDAATCKSADGEKLVAVATEGLASKQDPGRVLIFTLSDMGKLTFISEISTIGALPDSIHWTKNCRKIICAIEGEAAASGTSFVNPEGGVAFIDFPTDEPVSTGAMGSKPVAAELVAAGVRWSLTPERAAMIDDQDATEGAAQMTIPADQTTFSRDLEPEYVVLNHDETKAWITLQAFALNFAPENCAVAIVDIATMEIERIVPIPHKDWSQYPEGFDASNKDSGVNMQPWNVTGMRMPDTVKAFKAGNGKEYLVMSNEGDDKEYVWDNDAVWTEMIRGKDVTGVVAPLSDSYSLDDVKDQVWHRKRDGRGVGMREI